MDINVSASPGKVSPPLSSQPGSAPQISVHRSLRKRIYRYRYFYLMLAPVIAFLIVFNYIPMLGIRYAFYSYTPWAPPKFVGLHNFIQVFSSQIFWNAFKNTLFYSLTNLILGMFLSVFFALLMNELSNKVFKSITQTVLYMPYFLSWVVVASIFTLILSPQFGVVNAIIGYLGIKPIYFLASEKWWTGLYIFISRWKDTGWGTVIYLAALAGISPDLYEAASMDGAGRLKQTWHVTLPGIANTILIVLVLNLAKIMNLFESIYVLQNSSVINTAEVIQTYIYKVGLQQSDYGVSTAIGLFNSLIAMGLVLISNTVNKKVKGTGII